MMTMDPQPEVQSVLPFSSSWKQCLLLSLSKSQNPLLGSSLSQCPCSVCPGASTCHPKARAYWPGHPGLLKPFLLHWSYPACWIPWFHLEPPSLLVLSSSAPPWLSDPLSPFTGAPCPSSLAMVYWSTDFSLSAVPWPSIPLMSQWSSSFLSCLCHWSPTGSTFVFCASDLPAQTWSSVPVIWLQLSLHLQQLLLGHLIPRLSYDQWFPQLWFSLPSTGFSVCPCLFLWFLITFVTCF